MVRLSRSFAQTPSSTVREGETFFPHRSFSLSAFPLPYRLLREKPTLSNRYVLFLDVIEICWAIRFLRSETSVWRTKILVVLPRTRDFAFPGHFEALKLVRFLHDWIPASSRVMKVGEEESHRAERPQNFARCQNLPSERDQKWHASHLLQAFASFQRYPLACARPFCKRRACSCLRFPCQSFPSGHSHCQNLCGDGYIRLESLT